MAADAAPPPVLGPASLLDLAPELFDALDPAARSAARRHAVVRAARLEPGAWDPAPLAGAGTRPFAALVAGGLLVSEVAIGLSVAAELIGPGDVVGIGERGDSLLPAIMRWSAAEPVTVALLDAHLLPVLRAWPSVAAALTARAADRGRRLEVQRAISQLPRVEERLLALFGHLAERFGRMATDGVVVPVGLTHQMLGRLVGARRPTVSLALKDLASAGTLVRRGDGAWLVEHGALQGLTSDLPEGMTFGPPDAVLVALASDPVRAARAITVEHLHVLTARCQALGQVTARTRERSRETIARSAVTRERVHGARASRSGGR